MNISEQKKFNRARHKRVKSILASIISSGLLASSMVNADEIWRENFDAAELNGKGAVFNQVDMTNITKWSIDINQAQLTATSDWFKVNNGKFEGRDLDGIAIWQTEVIDISNTSNINISLNAQETGNHEGTDFIDVAYSVDGAAYTTVLNWQNKGSTEHTLVDDFTNETISISVASGNTLSLRVSMKNNAGSEYISFDNVLITADSGTVEPPVDPPENDTIKNACFNCPDLTKIADQANFDDAVYYASPLALPSNASNSDDLRNAIHSVISNNHKVLSYSEVWTALTKTDEDPLNNSNVILLYKGTSLAKFSNGSGTQSSDPDNWNREHVWAKSHGFPSSSAAAYTDIHHLRPTDISVNSSRGNLDFDYSDNALAEAPLNKVDGDSFEPRDAVKGDVARMAFYMDVRYADSEPQTPDLMLVDMLTSSGEAKLGKLCALLAWHEADPVDNFERARNNAAFEFQGNRNPFIDHPEWVTQIFTNTCDGTNPPGGGGENSDGLFISEYVEGSSYNKALEIFNPTKQTISLDGYQIKLYGNGNTSPTATASLSGQVLANDVIVVGSSRVSDDSAMKAKVDIFSSAINFNGDDYVELVKDEKIVDTFGIRGVRTNWGSNVTLVRKASVKAGETDFSNDFSVADEWDNYPSNTFEYLGSHNFEGDDVVEPEPSLIGACGDPAQYISAVQGNGTSSPLVGKNHIIEGVVTSVVSSLSGFFVQEEAKDNDADPETSEAIFVYANGQEVMPTLGQLVRVKGDVKEFYNRTQISLTEATLDCGSAASISETAITLPVEKLTQWESLEGMKVTFTQDLHVSDTYDLGQYGQLSLSYGRLIIPTNVYSPNSAQALDLADRNARNVIVLDDKNSSQYPEHIPFPNAGLSFNNAVRLGDTVNNISGVLDFSYSKYRILPFTNPTFTSTNKRSTSPTMNNESEITVASFNVLNYFNGDGQGGGFPTSRGADNFEEFTRQSSKVVSAIAEINADIVGLMEIENDGFGEHSAIADLTAKLNLNLGANTYQFISVPSPTLGNDAITVGFLYKPATVSLVGTTVTTNAVPFDFGNRQPLVQTFTSNKSGESFTVAVNHFKSKGSCSSASGANADQNDGQACWNELRTQAANKLVSWLATNPTGITSENVLIIGDLNAYGKEDPIRAITAQNYRNLIAEKIGHKAYSYGFGGKIGYLDHALASTSLATKVESVHEWHINADEPRIFDYNTEKKSNTQLAAYYDNSAYRASDHDPVIVSFSFSQPEVLVGDFDLDGDIDINDVKAFISQLRAGVVFDESYDFNKDGVVNSYDARTLMTLCTRSRCAIS